MQLIKAEDGQGPCHLLESVPVVPVRVTALSLLHVRSGGLTINNVKSEGI